MGEEDKPWLVTGGAGYIGAHVVHALKDQGQNVVVIDDLSSGLESRLDDVPLIAGSVLDEHLVSDIIRRFDVKGVMHIAAHKQVPESITNPLLYYRENVDGLRAILSAMSNNGIDRLVYTSSAAVYGQPNTPLVDESYPCAPINPYGQTKLIGEWMLQAQRMATGLRYVALRYFNVGGTRNPNLADRGCSNLIPIVLAALKAGRQPKIFGGDYATHDGSCIRDYIHVEDVASAHVAVSRLLDDDCAYTFNIGTGIGYSVREVIDSIADIAHLDVEPEVLDRRAGDPPAVVANVAKIRTVLGWQAEYTLADIARSAWQAVQAVETVDPLPAYSLAE